MNLPARSRAARRSGFTLIELLTVIAIIGILAAIMIPTIGKVRETAKAANCASNLRQIGSAMMLYAQANKNFLPRSYKADYTDPYGGAAGWWVRRWSYQIQPYFENKKATDQVTGENSVFVGVNNCPGKKNFDLTSANDLHRVSYSMNSFNPGGGAANKDIALSSLKNPSLTMLVSDTGTNWYECPNSDYLYNDTAVANSMWHGNKNNTLFADGHVEAIGKGGLNYYLMKATDNAFRPL